MFKRKKKDDGVAVPVTASALKPVQAGPIASRTVSVKDGATHVDITLNPIAYLIDHKAGTLTFTKPQLIAMRDHCNAALEEASRLEGAVASLYPVGK